MSTVLRANMEVCVCFFSVTVIAALIFVTTLYNLFYFTGDIVVIVVPFHYLANAQCSRKLQIIRIALQTNQFECSFVHCCLR